MTSSDVSDGLMKFGFCQVGRDRMAALLGETALAGWRDFAASWDDLGMDTYMADGGRYRRRRHAAYAVANGKIMRKPHQPHYQSRDYNRLNGGIERWFQPVVDSIGVHPILMGLLGLCESVFDHLVAAPLRPAGWHCEVHQFRIESSHDRPGRPTPEGNHQDGVDGVLVLLVRRENIDRGTTTILDLKHTEIGTFTLTEPLDSAWVDDNRVFHGVTPIVAVDPDRPAFRDVLVITFRRA